MKHAIHTDNAPAAIGSYSQGILSSGRHVFLSGQIPMLRDGMVLNNEPIQRQIHQVFHNLSAVAEAAGGSLSDTVKLTVYLTDLANMDVVNQVMSEHFQAPYPARAAVQVSALPKGACVEIEGVLSLP